MRSHHRRPYLLILLIALVFSMSGVNAYALTPMKSISAPLLTSSHALMIGCDSPILVKHSAHDRAPHVGLMSMSDAHQSLSEHCKNTPHTGLKTLVGNHCQSGHCNDNMCGSVVGVLLSSTLVMFGTSTYLDVFYPLHSHQLTGYPRSLYRPPIA